jgi:Lipocalin-like domain
MRVMALITQIVVLSVLALPGIAVGQSAPSLVGTWQLVAYEARDSAGGVQYPLGQGAIGQFTFDANGHMSLMLMKPDRPLFASHDLHRGTDAEVRAAFDGFIAYFGTYTVDPAKRTVALHMRAASYPNWVGGDQIRYYKLDGPRLVLTTPPIPVNGRSLVLTLAWERAP